MKQAILVLYADEPGGLGLCGGIGFPKLLNREVRASNFPNLPFLDEFVQSPKRVGNGDFWVGLVELIQVDMVGAKSPQGVFSRFEHVVRMSSAALLIDLHAEFCGYNYLVAPLAQGPAEVFLAFGTAVDICRVEEIDSLADGGIYYFGGGILVELASEVVAAHADNRYFERANSSCKHSLSFRYNRAVKTLRQLQIDLLRTSRLIVVALGASVASACASMHAPKPVPSEPVSPAMALSTFDTLWTVVRNTYVDTAFVASRWTALRDTLRPRASMVANRKELDDLLETTLKRIPDSHFYIIPEAAADPNEKDNPTGVGGTTGIAVRSIRDKAVVWRVDPGSPAAASGITAGQIIARIGDRDLSAALKKVDDVPAAGRARALSEVLFSFNRAVSSATGTTVHVGIANGGKVVGHTLVAVPRTGTISQYGNLPPIAGRVVAEKVGGANDPCVGVIGFNIWLPALVPEMERAMDGITSCKGIVIDLRGNPGGVGAMVMGFGGYFVDSVISLGTMRSRQVSLRFVMNPRYARNDGSAVKPYEGPVAILVDPMSASTSEIFAAGMQRIGRARVFGEQSAGAALPAMMDRLPSGDVFVHAVADFTDPDGKRIEGAGVVPDEMTPLSETDLASGRDTALEAAVRWIRSNPAVHRAPVSQSGSVHPNFN